MVDHKRTIVIKRPIIEAPHHGGAWKIAYADFMTAMFAFFLVMWLLSSSTKSQLTGIAEQFKMPLKVALSGGSKSSTSTSVIPGGGDDPIHTDGETKKSESPEDSEDSSRLDQLKEKLEEMIRDNPILKEFSHQLIIDITPEGLRIQIADSKNRPMFDRSSPLVMPYMQRILQALGPVLNEQSTKVTLSGHTDSTKYPRGNSAYSNWELSSDRANASRRELVVGGLQDLKVLRVMGVADSMHLNKEDPSDAKNRRISIVVLNHHTQDSIERANESSASITPRKINVGTPAPMPSPMPSPKLTTAPVQNGGKN